MSAAVSLPSRETGDVTPVGREIEIIDVIKSQRQNPSRLPMVMGCSRQCAELSVTRSSSYSSHPLPSPHFLRMSRMKRNTWREPLRLHVRGKRCRIVTSRRHQPCSLLCIARRDCSRSILEQGSHRCVCCLGCRRLLHDQPPSARDE